MAKNKIAQQVLNFIQKSPSPFHVIENLANELKIKGFTELYEGEKWVLKENFRYFVRRNNSAIISFVVPKKSYKGYLIAASHSDSPSFKVKENPEMKNLGTIRFNVEKYGGMLMNTWFDKPLSIAGRVVVSSKNGEKICVEQKLVNIDRDLLVIPSLAIHMNRDANEGHKIDCQKEIVPIFTTDETSSLKQLLSEECGIPEEDILSYDLFLYNRIDPVFWGKNNEFIASSRLDDLECVYTTFKAFESSVNEDYVTIHCVFDNEETGSQSRQGAGSTFLRDVLLRINEGMCRANEEYLTAIAESFVVSADNAHASHPNYQSASDPVNQPKVNGGVVIKYNASQKYTTDSISAAFFKEVCNKAKVPYQIFTNNSNIVGGSTLGNISTTQVASLSVDIGLAQWAMHSSYESAGAHDPEYMVKAMQAFYEGKYGF